MASDYMQGVVAAIRRASTNGDVLPSVIERDHSLVMDLGFDSLKMALLSLALETEFERTIVLDEWIGSHSDPNELTVGSLSDFVRRTIADEAAHGHTASAAE